MITRKHVFEIARIKQQDDMWQEFDLQDICDEVVNNAFTCGVKVVDEIDPVEYGDFLAKRAEIVATELAEIKAAKEAKLLRT